MQTIKEIAETAARKVLTANIEKINIYSPSEDPITALSWVLGEGIEHEDGLKQLILAAIETDRAGWDAAATAIDQALIKALEEKRRDYGHRDVSLDDPGSIAQLSIALDVAIDTIRALLRKAEPVEYLAEKRWVIEDFTDRLRERIEDGEEADLKVDEVKGVCDHISGAKQLSDCTDDDWIVVDMIIDDAIANYKAERDAQQNQTEEES